LAQKGLLLFEKRDVAILLTLDDGLRYPKVENCDILLLWENGNLKTDINICYNNTLIFVCK